MSSGVKSTIITTTTSGISIPLNINAVAAVYLTKTYDDTMCGLWYHSTGQLYLTVFSRDVISDRIDTEFIHVGEQFRVLYVD